jgi:hypothetical protein
MSTTGDGFDDWLGSGESCAGFDRNHGQALLPLLPVTETTLINVEYQLTRDEWDVFFDQLNGAV